MSNAYIFSTKPLSRKSGITIIESVVALVLFAVFTTAASKLLMTHRRVSDMARAHYTAINIAKNRMELVRTFDFYQVNDFIESDVIVDESGLPDVNGNYRRSTLISNVSSNLMQLTVTVEMRNRRTLQFNPSQQELTTYFALYLPPGGGTAPPPPAP